MFSHFDKIRVWKEKPLKGKKKMREVETILEKEGEEKWKKNYKDLSMTLTSQKLD